MVTRDGDRRGAPARLPPAARRAAGRNGPAAAAPLRAVTSTRPPCTARRAGSGACAPSGSASGANWTQVPVVAFLVEHPGAGPCSWTRASTPRSWWRRTRRSAESRGGDQGRERGAGAARVATAARLGIQPADVEVVVMTHLHSDHASGIAEFPSRPSWSRAPSGRRPARAGASRGTGHASSTTPSTGARSTSSRPTPDSYATFGRAFDLFGDGSVRVVSTPGHTAGHMSVVLRLRDR